MTPDAKPAKESRKLPVYVAATGTGMAAAGLGGIAGWNLGEILTPQNWYTTFGFAQVVQDNPQGSSLDQIAGVIIPYITSGVGALGLGLATAGVTYHVLTKLMQKDSAAQELPATKTPN